MLRRVGIVLATLLVLVAVVHGGVWYWATGRMKAELAAQVPALQAQGWTLRAGQPVRAGWPLEAALDLPGVSLTGTPEWAPGGLTWRTEQLRLAVKLWHPTRLRVVPSGRQSLAAGAGPSLAFEASALDAEVSVLVPERVDVHATALRSVAPPGLEIGSVQATLEPRGVRLSAGGITLPPGMVAPLGREISGIDVDAEISTPLPPVTDPAQRLAAWRDAGGKVVFRNLSLRWGSLDLVVDATLTLDARLQPSGSGTARVRGATETLAAMQASGFLTRSQALAANAVLSLLIRPAGEAAGVSVPLSLQDSVLSAGQIPLGRFPAVTWLPP